MHMSESPQEDTSLHCPKCGYNLTAITSNRCPECGERFLVTNNEGYLRKFPPSNARKACRFVWSMGTAVVILSWFRIVAPEVGWAGFAASMAAWLVSLGLKR